MRCGSKPPCGRSCADAFAAPTANPAALATAHNTNDQCEVFIVSNRLPFVLSHHYANQQRRAQVRGAKTQLCAPVIYLVRPEREPSPAPAVKSIFQFIPK